MSLQGGVRGNLLATRLFSPQDLNSLIEMVFSFYLETGGTSGNVISPENIMRTVNRLAGDPSSGKIVLLEINGQVAGYAIVIYYWSNEFGGEILFIDELYIKPAWRRRGAARAFLTSLEQNENVVALQLKVDPANTSACGLFARCGFTALPNHTLFKLCREVLPPQHRRQHVESKGNAVLVTERLLLKVIDGAYADRVFEFFQRNQQFLSEWEPLRPAVFYTREFQRKEIENELKNIQQGKMFKTWLFKKGDRRGDRIIGSVALSNITRGCFQSCLLGYRMDREETNKGYMTEALRVITRYAFRELGLHRIEANIMPRNRASLRVAEKLGFYHEGTARQYLNINGRWEDHLRLVLLNTSGRYTPMI